VGMQISSHMDSKYCRKELYGDLRKYLGEVFREVVRRKESEILEGHLMPDDSHMLISISPNYAVSQVVGFMKGKSAIQIAREFFGRRKNFTGEEFWARGYHVCTVGRNEEAMNRSIKVDGFVKGRHPGENRGPVNS